MDNQQNAPATNDDDRPGGTDTTVEQGHNTETPEAGSQEPKKELDLEAALKELKQARSEAARYRTERNALNEAAEKWKQHEDSQKSELQLAQERLAELEQELSQAQSTNLLLEVATAHGIKSEDMALLGTGTKEELEQRAARISELYGAASLTPTTPPPSQQPRQNTNSGSGVNTKTEDDSSYPEAWKPASLRDQK